MNGTALLSDQTAALVAQYEKGLSIIEKLPDTAQVMALYVAKMTTKVITAVQNQLTDEAVVTLHQGKIVPIDFNSETPITAEALQHAREGLNSKGYFLLVCEVSRNHYKLLVGKHRAMSKRQSRLLWAAPSTVSFIIGLTWEKALRKLSGIFPKDDLRNAQIDAESAWIEEAIQRQKVKEQKRAAENPAAMDDKTWEIQNHLRYREAEAIIRARRRAREYGERRIDSLPKGETGYIIPWALQSNEDGSYWLDPKRKCVNRAMGTSEMEVKWTRKGPMVLLPKDFNYQRTIKQSNYECFAGNKANFKWVLVNSKPQ